MKKIYILSMIFIWCVFQLPAQTTSNKGALDGSWQLIPSGVEENLLSVHFAGNTHGYISGELGRCLKSANGGLNWSNLSIPSYAWLMTVWATSPDVVHIGAWDSIYNTTNGGQTWNGVCINTVNYYVMDMQFHTADLGYAFLQASAFKKTTDGGNTWSEMTGSGVIDDFLSGFMIDETNGFAVGGAGLICQTTDGGQTWPQYEWNGWTEWSPLDIEGVHFTSAMNGFAVADSGVLFRTTNGGQHWDKQYLAGPEDRLKDIFFLDANLGWIVGYHGIIFSTTDGGDTWFPDAVPTTQDLNAVFFTASDLGWAVGSGGTILRLSGSSSAVDDHSLLKHDDLKVYPNPVSATAYLELTLPQEMEVSIDIFDLSGRKILPVYTGSLSGGTTILEIRMPSMGNGNYLCKVSYTGGQISKTLIITN